jgi:hypothetical protein
MNPQPGVVEDGALLRQGVEAMREVKDSLAGPSPA